MKNIAVNFLQFFFNSSYRDTPNFEVDTQGDKTLIII